MLRPTQCGFLLLFLVNFVLGYEIIENNKDRATPIDGVMYPRYLLKWDAATEGLTEEQKYKMYREWSDFTASRLHAEGKTSALDYRKDMACYPGHSLGGAVEGGLSVVPSCDELLAAVEVIKEGKEMMQQMEKTDQDLVSPSPAIAKTLSQEREKLKRLRDVLPMASGQFSADIQQLLSKTDNLLSNVNADQLAAMQQKIETNRSQLPNYQNQIPPTPPRAFLDDSANNASLRRATPPNPGSSGLNSGIDDRKSTIGGPIRHPGTLRDDMMANNGSAQRNSSREHYEHARDNILPKVQTWMKENNRSVDQTLDALLSENSSLLANITHGDTAMLAKLRPYLSKLKELFRGSGEGGQSALAGGIRRVAATILNGNGGVVDKMVSMYRQAASSGSSGGARGSVADTIASLMRKDNQMTSLGSGNAVATG